MQRGTVGAGSVRRRRLLGLALATGLGVGGSLLPGVERASLNLLAAAGPISPERLSAEAATYLDAPQHLALGEQTWALDRRALGLSLTVDPPVEPGAGPSLPFGRAPATLIVALDGEALARTVATLPGLDRPPIDAALRLDGVAVIVTPDHPGQRLDRAALAALLVERARLLDDAPVDLPVAVTLPATTAADLEPAAAMLRRALARPLALAGVAGPAAIPPAAIAGALTGRADRQGDTRSHRLGALAGAVGRHPGGAADRAGFAPLAGRRRGDAASAGPDAGRAGDHQRRLAGVAGRPAGRGAGAASDRAAPHRRRPRARARPRRPAAGATAGAAGRRGGMAADDGRPRPAPARLGASPDG